MKPDSITLWIAHTDQDKLPQQVTALKKFGIDIRFCDDLLSYKKIVPELKTHPDSYIVIADDDVFYPYSWLEELVVSKRGPKDIVCHRIHKIKMSPTGAIAPYQEWSMNINGSKASALNFATGVGGVLYPPHSLHSDVTKSEVFMEICPRGDDIWLYWMARMRGYKFISPGPSKKFIPWTGSQKAGLQVINAQNGASGNDEQIQKILNHYGWPNNT
jgi:hypothetical protein